MDGIAVLGPARIIADAVAQPLPSRRQRLLLAMLVTRFGQPVASSALTEALWGDDLPQHPAAALQSQVFRLRRQLDPARVRIETVRDGYRLDAERAAIDACRFEDLVAAAGELRHDPSAALELLEQALALWRGRAFDDVADDPAIIGRATGLDELRADVGERRAALLFDLGRSVEAASAMEALSEEHPFREQPVSIRMRALARQGRHADALAAYSGFRTRLGEALGLEPSPDLRAVEHEILTHEQPSRPRIGLPGNSLVGREVELAEVAAHLRSRRVVTLTGPGGVGKTRLALHAAVADSDRHPDGVWLCELAGITDGDSVATAVATALRVEHSAGRTELERIVEFLRARRALLVLDNCEHVVDGASELVRRLLADAPDVAVLATSRRRLGVAGEQVVPVEPLGVGYGDDSPAVSLFLDRARAVRPGIVFDDTALADIRTLCRSLDGLPLAVELAAARTSARTPSEILEEVTARVSRLEDPMRSGERHRSIEAVLAWSYDRLGSFEQRVLRHAAVFAGGFTRGAAAAVADADATHVADALASLVEHSMVVARDAHGSTRFSMLEPIRQFAEARLVQAGEADAARARHAAWLASWIEGADEALRGPSEADAAAGVADEIANLRAAVHWALDHDPSIAVRIAGAMYTYAYWYGSSEAFAWALQAVSATLSDQPAPGTAKAFATATLAACRRGDVWGARALAERGIAAAGEQPADARFVYSALSSAEVMSGNYDAALACQQRAFEHAVAVGDLAHQARERAARALVLGYRGEPDAAADELSTARALADASRNPTLLAFCDYVGGELLVERDPAGARPSLERARAAARLIGNRYLAAIAGVSAVSCAARSGEPAHALGGFAELLDYFDRAGSSAQQWTTIRALIETLATLDRVEEAATLYGALTASASALPIIGADAARLAAVMTALADRLGQVRLDELVAAGARLGDRQAIAYAMRAITDAE